MAGGPLGPVPQALLAKEAAYNAVAVGAYELHDYLQFTPWLRSTLLPVSARPPLALWPAMQALDLRVPAGRLPTPLLKCMAPCMQRRLLSALSPGKLPVHIDALFPTHTCHNAGAGPEGAGHAAAASAHRAGGFGMGGLPGQR